MFEKHSKCARPEELRISGPAITGFLHRPRASHTREQFVGILDTGASMSSVCVRLLKTMGLVPNDVKVFDLAGVKAPLPVYDVGMYIENDKGNLYHLSHLVVAGMPEPLGHYDALIGRDILSQGVFKYDGRAGSYQLVLYGAAKLP